MTEDPDIIERRRSPYTVREKIKRMVWGAVQGTVFRYTFHNWYGIRRRILRAFGAKLAPTVNIRRTAIFECPWNLTIGDGSTVGDRAILYCLGPVTIGRNVTVSQGAHICAGSHDSRKRSMPLLRPPVEIGDEAWIAADAFIGPRVKVGEGVILAARGVALENLEPWSIYRGNPAVRVKARELEGR